jgi:hypothetical protein
MTDQNTVTLVNLMSNKGLYWFYVADATAECINWAGERMSSCGRLHVATFNSATNALQWLFCQDNIALAPPPRQETD